MPGVIIKINFFFCRKGDPRRPDTPEHRYAIKYINCPIVKDYVTNGELVLMRCSHGKIVHASDCLGILHITCSKDNEILRKQQNSIS